LHPVTDEDAQVARQPYAKLRLALRAWMQFGEKSGSVPETSPDFPLSGQQVVKLF
jgi:hypothetical protein